jgi:putative FmdB family regulatory protein
MPTYEYACTACGHRLEAVQSFTDDPLAECPECGSALRKVYGNVGIVLKGSGFYKTDSRAAAGGNGAGAKSPEKSTGDTAGGDSTPSKESPAAAGNGSGNGAGADSKSDSKSDSKPAATTAS